MVHDYSKHCMVKGRRPEQPVCGAHSNQSSLCGGHATEHSCLVPLTISKIVVAKVTKERQKTQMYI